MYRDVSPISITLLQYRSSNVYLIWLDITTSLSYRFKF